MKLSVKILAIGLALGIVGAPAEAQPGWRGHHNGWHGGHRGWHGGHRGWHGGYRGGYGRGYGWRGGRRYGYRGGRVCRTHFAYGRRVTRCFWR